MSVKKGDVFNYNGNKLMFVQKLDTKKHVFFDIGANKFVFLTGIPSVKIETDVKLFKKIRNEKIKEIKGLKVGQHFTLDNDKTVYVFIELSSNDRIHFYKDDETNMFSCSMYGIIRPLPKIDFDFQRKMSANLFKSIKDVSSAVKMNEFYKILNIACNFSTSLGEVLKDESMLEFEILDHGNIVKGEGFYHEVDEYYVIYGVELKIRRKMNLVTTIYEDTAWGFYPIYVGKSHNCAPIIFDESYREDYGAHKYSNGCGDHVEILEVVKSRDEIKNTLPNFSFESFNKK